MPPKPPSVFEFLDYRAFLRALVAAHKRSRASFSYASIARRAGIRSKGFLKHVIEGERNLTLESARKFARAFGLEDKEQEFFLHLVAFNQAATAAEANQHFEQINASRRFRAARRIDGAMFEYLSSWYYPAIREMAARPDFRDDPQWIARELFPPIRPSQAAHALATLLQLGVLVREHSGRIRRGEPALDTGHEVDSRAIVNIHRELLDRAAESLESVPGAWRDVSATTVCIHPDTVADLKQRIHGFREAVEARCDDDQDPSVVYQFNMQLFPVSRVPAGAGVTDRGKE